MVIVKEPSCDVDTLVQLVQKHVPSAQLESNVSAELSFRLPQDAAHRYSGTLSRISAKISQDFYW